jgi:hypothetical protein
VGAIHHGHAAATKFPLDRVLVGNRGFEARELIGHGPPKFAA